MLEHNLREDLIVLLYIMESTQDCQNKVGGNVRPIPVFFNSFGNVMHRRVAWEGDFTHHLYNFLACVQEYAKFAVSLK